MLVIFDFFVDDCFSSLDVISDGAMNFEIVFSDPHVQSSVMSKLDYNDYACTIRLMSSDSF